MAEEAKRLSVYVVTEKAGLDRVVWTKVGDAYRNRDGSYNLHLDALPLNGKLHMREVADVPKDGDRPA